MYTGAASPRSPGTVRISAGRRSKRRSVYSGTLYAETTWSCPENTERKRTASYSFGDIVSVMKFRVRGRNGRRNNTPRYGKTEAGRLRKRSARYSRGRRVYSSTRRTGDISRAAVTAPVLYIRLRAPQTVVVSGTLSVRKK